MRTGASRACPIRGHPSTLASSHPRFGCISQNQRVLAIETELLDREDHGLWFDQNDLHSAQRRACGDLISRLGRDVAERHHRPSACRVIQDPDELEVAYSWTQFGARKQREEGIAAPFGV